MIAIYYWAHSFWSKGEEPPVRIPCHELFTSEHVLLYSADFIDASQKYFETKSLRTLPSYKYMKLCLCILDHFKYC